MLGLWCGVFGLVIYIVGKIGTNIASNYANDITKSIDNLSQFPWRLIAGVLVFTTLVSLFSGLGPAIKAAKLNPVDALHSE